jgi:hypothetical protein
LKRCVFRSVIDLQAAINRFLAGTDNDPKPFTWAADADRIIAAVKRGPNVRFDPLVANQLGAGEHDGRDQVGARRRRGVPTAAAHV